MDVISTQNTKLIEKYRESKDHPLVQDAVISHSKIPVDEIKEYDNCLFDSCTFKGKPKVFFYRCKFANCNYSRDLLDNMLECIILDTKDINGFKKRSRKRGLLYAIRNRGRNYE